MADKNYTKLYVVLDSSGSMLSTKKDAEGGFNSFMNEQRKMPGKCDVTLVEFSNNNRVIYKDKDLREVPNLTLRPSGGTALRDALGDTIVLAREEIKRLRKPYRPGVVGVLVVSDGEENSSHRWSAPQIKTMIDEQTAKSEKSGNPQWIFTFIGSNQDAVTTGREYGFAQTHSLTFDPNHTLDSYNFASASMANARGSVAAGASFGDTIVASSFADDEREKAATSS